MLPVFFYVEIYIFVRSSSMILMEFPCFKGHLITVQETKKNDTGIAEAKAKRSNNICHSLVAGMNCH